MTTLATNFALRYALGSCGSACHLTICSFSRLKSNAHLHVSWLTNLDKPSTVATQSTSLRLHLCRNLNLQSPLPAPTSLVAPPTPQYGVKTRTTLSRPAQQQANLPRAHCSVVCPKKRCSTRPRAPRQLMLPRRSCAPTCHGGGRAVHRCRANDEYLRAWFAIARCDYIPTLNLADMIYGRYTV